MQLSLEVLIFDKTKIDILFLFLFTLNSVHRCRRLYFVKDNYDFKVCFSKNLLAEIQFLFDIIQYSVDLHSELLNIFKFSMVLFRIKMAKKSILVIRFRQAHLKTSSSHYTELYKAPDTHYIQC